MFTYFYFFENDRSEADLFSVDTNVCVWSAQNSQSTVKREAMPMAGITGATGSVTSVLSASGGATTCAIAAGGVDSGLDGLESAQEKGFAVAGDGGGAGSGLVGGESAPMPSVSGIVVVPTLGCSSIGLS